MSGLFDQPQTIDAAISGQAAVLSAVGAPMSRAETSVHADSARSIVAAMGREGMRRSPVQFCPFETEEHLIQMLARVLR